ncbi:MAG: 16S rRNA (uracil(1498)-N(3))-methyltransferase [Halioglobus sp.]
MRIPRIYTAQALAANSVLTLEPQASAHIGRALRMRAGDAITLFNGDGNSYNATIDEIGKRAATINVLEQLLADNESPLQIELGIAISRGDRMDWIVQKATELGVNRITPLQTERGEVKLKGERAEKKLGHWRQISISACEQCGRNQLPQLSPLTGLDSWLSNVSAQRKFVLHHRDTSLDKSPKAPESVAILVGPEGGLSPAEIDVAIDKGFEALTLGPRVLRTETAPLAAIAILQAAWGDMSFEA